MLGKAITGIEAPGGEEESVKEIEKSCEGQTVRESVPCSFG